MKKGSLEYRLLHPTQPVDFRTHAAIIYSVDRLTAFMDTFGERDKLKRIVVDNNTISMLKPASKIITAAGYVPRGKALYLYSPTTFSSEVPLSQPLEEMTIEEAQLLGLQEEYVGINPQLLVALRDYALEQPEQPE